MIVHKFHLHLQKKSNSASGQIVLIFSDCVRSFLSIVQSVLKLLL